VKVAHRSGATGRRTSAKAGPGQGTPQKALITDAQAGTSADLASRQFRYGVAMAFRIVCFLAMFWAPSPFRWILLGAAIVLPYVAVLIANQADQRTNRSGFEQGAPAADVPELTAGSTLYLEQPDESDDQAADAHAEQPQPPTRNDD
jgi:hypothetical protein